MFLQQRWFLFSGQQFGASIDVPHTQPCMTLTWVRNSCDRYTQPGKAALLVQRVLNPSEGRFKLSKGLENFVGGILVCSRLKGRQVLGSGYVSGCFRGMFQGYVSGFAGVQPVCP